jgi:protein glucosyltransferase
MTDCATILVFFSILSVVKLELENGYCDSKDGCQEIDPRKYDSDSNFYIKTIDQELRNYKPCSQANCSCNLDVLKQDLAPYKSGITKQMIDDVQDRGTKFQIFDHR